MAIPHAATRPQESKAAGVRRSVPPGAMWANSASSTGRAVAAWWMSMQGKTRRTVSGFGVDPRVQDALTR
jgi:hypothetical protein